MYVDFDSLAKDSRIWIYQSIKKLSLSQINDISAILKNQISNWSSHGVELKGSFKVFYDHVVVVAVDQNFNLPSGCSIDTSSRWIKEISISLGIDLFDRSLPYFSENKLRFAPIFEVKKFITEQKIFPHTPILNHQINSISQMESQWKIDAKDSFLKRYFENTLV
jgi:hypothetical protein